MVDDPIEVKRILWVGEPHEEARALADLYEVMVTSPDSDLKAVVTENEPDMVIIDLTAGDDKALRLLLGLHKILLDAPIMGLVEADNKILSNAIEAGLQDFIFTPIRHDELVMRMSLAAKRLIASRTYSLAAGHIQSATSNLNLPTDFGVIAPVADILTRDLKTSGLATAEQVFHLRLTLSEILTNAMEHGSLEIDLDTKVETLEGGNFDTLVSHRLKDRNYADRRVFVDVERTEDVITYTVQDQGPGFDVDKTMALLSEPDPTMPCGRGLFFLRQFVDDFHFSDGGRRLTLSKILGTE